MTEILRVLQPLEHFKYFLNLQRRPDRPDLLQTRPINLSIGKDINVAISTLVKLGETVVKCSIRTGFAAPRADDPEKGFIVPEVEIRLNSYSKQAQAIGMDQSPVLKQTLNNIIKGSKCIREEDLCVEKAKVVRTLYINCYCLNDDGSILDAMLLATVAALKNVRLPKVTLDEDDKILAQGDETIPLPLYCYPASLTTAFYNGQCLPDPTQEEEGLCSDLVTVVMDEKGRLCHLNSKGENGITTDQMLMCFEQATNRCSQIMALLEKLQH